MSWFSNIFSKGAATVVDSVASGLDSLFTSDEERLTAKNLMQAEMNKFKAVVIDAQSKYDAEITARWKSDNEHSVTRLVRPVAYGAVLFAFFIITFMDGNAWGFSIKEAYIPVFEGLLYTMTIAYFGSRGIEKVAKTIGKNK